MNAFLDETKRKTAGELGIPDGVCINTHKESSLKLLSQQKHRLKKYITAIRLGTKTVKIKR